LAYPECKEILWSCTDLRFLSFQSDDSFLLHDHGHGTSGVAVYIPALLVHIAPTHGRIARLSWPASSWINI